MSAQPENLQITVEFVLTARKENMQMREDQLHAKIAKKEGTQRQKQAKSAANVSQDLSLEMNQHLHVMCVPVGSMLLNPVANHVINVPLEDARLPMLLRSVVIVFKEGQQEMK
tara:strand:+ start:113 stop:451 length:339 start_codon:yes stop_codon:yes gene_type:complete